MAGFMLAREAGRLDPGRGLALAEHFQMAYLTNDIDRAKALFAERLGIVDYRELDGPMPEGGSIRVALAWVGPLMYELMETTGSDLALYTGWLPEGGGFRIRHHHLGYLVPDRAGIHDLETAGRHGWPVAHRNSNPLVDVAFVEAPELGHYLEYMAPTPAGLDFFNGVPRS